MKAHTLDALPQKACVQAGDDVTVVAMQREEQVAIASRMLFTQLASNAWARVAHVIGSSA